MDSSTVNVDFDAVFGGKSVAHEFRVTTGKTIYVHSIYASLKELYSYTVDSLVLLYNGIMLTF